MSKSKVDYDRIHISLDLETMGIDSNSALVAVGAIGFRIGHGEEPNVISKFYCELAWRDQGRYISSDTKEWWLKQDEDVRSALYGKTTADEFISKFNHWFPTNRKPLIWGNGPRFDMGILTDFYNDNLCEIPWLFYNERDVRTIRDLLDCSIGRIFDPHFKGVKHNAADDALHQARIIQRGYKELLP